MLGIPHIRCDLKLSPNVLQHEPPERLVGGQFNLNKPGNFHNISSCPGVMGARGLVRRSSARIDGAAVEEPFPSRRRRNIQVSAGTKAMGYPKFTDANSENDCMSSVSMGVFQ